MNMHTFCHIFSLDYNKEILYMDMKTSDGHTDYKPL